MYRQLKTVIGRIMGRPHLLRDGLAAIGAAALIAASVAAARFYTVNPASAAPVQPPPGSEAGYPRSFAPLVRAVSPAVVNISSTAKLSVPDFESEQGVPPFPPGSPFGQLFRKFFQQQFGNANEKVTSLGSGFIIDPSGYVVTNNHVIANATHIKVILNDGQTFPAKLIGHDPKTDLALLKFNPGKPMPYVKWGNSDSAKVGDWVLAIGNPFGLGGTVTAGIVSARGRNLNRGPFDDYLQVDAPINKGNSGGPLFNLKGEVIGINTAIITPNGGSVGIGFSIPSNEAAPVVAQLKKFGHVKRGWLGVSIQTVTPAIAESLGLSTPHGALVAQVMPNTPAERAGLKQGDVIVAFNGKPVKEMHDLPLIVADTPAGKTVPIEVVRDGKTLTLHATIAEMKPGQEVASAEEGGNGQTSPVHSLGLALAPLNSQTRQRFHVDKSVTGVIIVGVQDGSVAASQGLQPGDVIVRVGSESVTEPEQVKSKFAAAIKEKKKSILVLLDRGGHDLFVALNPKKS